MMATNINNEPWYHGFISRQEAEEILTRGGKTDGLYLVRDSISQIGSYALSMCHGHRIIHYNAQRQPDGSVAIEDGPKFSTPTELVSYHSTHLDGLLYRLLKPCARLPGIQPKTNSGINQKHIRDAADKALESMGIVEQQDPSMQTQMESFLGKVLHQSECWFHGNISRDEAEKRLQRCGNTNGLFLIRERKAPPGTYAMGLCYNNSVVHYLFDSDSNGLLSIQSGPKFENLMLAVDHYTMHNDGLLHNLQQPCDITLFEERRKSIRHPEFLFPTGRPASRSFNEDNQQPPRSGSLDAAAKNEPKSPKSPTAPLPGVLSTSPRPDQGASSSQNFEGIYDSVKLKKSSGYVNQFKSFQNQSFDLKSENLSLGKELGHGNFGSVLKGTYTLPNGEKIPVAVKRLKSEELNNPKSEIMHEAKVMMKLDHPYIVRIIGMCTTPTMMLVMELAASGPLNKYLKSKKNMEMLNILILMLQVAEGMQYLEGQQFVHRDLAARNVLVVNDSFIKISDFGMSRAMGAGSDYYKAETPGKWPLKWYAPECIYFRKFSSKSDVWSYGVTLWEATSYGARPYQGMNGQIIIQKLENGYRLPAPLNVPMEVYKVMKSCWEYKEEDRPSFKNIWRTLGDIISRLKGS